MNDILCIEIDSVAKTGRPPLAPTGPFSQLSRTGRWVLLRDEALDLLKMDANTRRAIRESRKAFLSADAYEDFFGKDQETPDDQDQLVQLP